MQHGILDGILKQEKDINRKMKSRVNISPELIVPNEVWS